MKLVQLEPDDWQRYRDLRLLALRSDPEAFYSTAESDGTLSEKQWRRRLEAASYVVEGNGSDLGLVTTLPYAEDDAADGDWQLVSMWVAPAARGQGVGHRLVEAAVEHARAAGARRLVLWVAWGNLRAELLYEAHGFKRTGVTGSFPPPRETPEFQMALKL